MTYSSSNGGDKRATTGVSDQKRIFILRPDNLGDLILFSGALKHFRKLWPTAHITLCVRHFGLELFANCPHLDELISFDKCYGEICGQGVLSRMLQIRGYHPLGSWLRRTIPGLVPKAYRSDTAILPLLAPCFEHHTVMKLIPARNKIGICGNYTNQTVHVDRKYRGHYSAQMDGSHLAWNFPELELTRLFLKFLGIELTPADILPEFWTTSEDSVRADGWMVKNSGKITLGIAPGFSNPNKKLPPHWFTDVVNLLKFRNLQIVLIGSAADLTVGNEVAKTIEKSSIGIPVLNLTGQTSVLQMVECIKRCDMVLSQDTAALHVATALRKPVVGIVGGGHFGRFYPWGDPLLSRLVNKPMDCYGCNWQCKFESVRCIEEISSLNAAENLNELHMLI
jgi:ADP-heptose:LPS heptosyltransferase